MYYTIKNNYYFKVIINNKRQKKNLITITKQIRKIIRIKRLNNNKR